MSGTGIDWRNILARRETKTHFVIEGKLAVERLQASDYLVEKTIQVGEDLSREEVSELLGFHFHRGHLAIAQKPTNLDLTEFGKGTIVVLPEIADPGNLGTIIRNTAALGGAGVLLGKGASPFNAKAVRSSAGTLFQLPVRQSPDLVSDLRELAQTRTIIGTCLSDGAIPFSQLPDFKNPLALLLGPEDFGIDAETRALCDHLVYLPMDREIDSLNVASASAIFLHGLR